MAASASTIIARNGNTERQMKPKPSLNADMATIRFKPKGVILLTTTPVL